MLFFISAKVFDIKRNYTELHKRVTIIETKLERMKK